MIFSFKVLYINAVQYLREILNLYIICPSYGKRFYFYLKRRKDKESKPSSKLDLKDLKAHDGDKNLPKELNHRTAYRMVKMKLLRRNSSRKNVLIESILD